MVHSFLLFFMVWLHNRPLNLVIAPGLSSRPIMCIDDSAIALNESKCIQQKSAPILKKNGLKEPLEKQKPPAKKVVKKLPEKKKPLPKKIEKKKEIIKPVVKEVKPKPVDPVQKPTVNQNKTNEILNINLASHTETELGAEVYGALQSSWAPPVGVAPKKACVVCLQLKNDGTIGSLVIEQSSGIPVYDLAAKAAISKTQFPRQIWNRAVRFSFI